MDLKRPSEVPDGSDHGKHRNIDEPKEVWFKVLENETAA